jgi:hypothetical protein
LKKKSLTKKEKNMYIENTTTYYVGTEQRARKARFLILLQPDKEESGDKEATGNNLRGIVRQVALQQLGHFMMGRVKISEHRLSVSGAYGHDGLPCTVPREVWIKGTPLPKELYDAWNKGGGWNSAGSEAPAMRIWALTFLVPFRNGIRRTHAENS